MTLFHIRTNPVYHNHPWDFLDLPTTSSWPTHHHQPQHHPLCHWTPDDLFTPKGSLIIRAGPLTSSSTSTGRKVKTPQAQQKPDKNQFQVLLDVQQFKPEELDVKSQDNQVVITGKHEERQDEHGFISREFTRRYILPTGVKPEDVKCHLTSDGILHITALKRTQETLPENEIRVPITQTGQPAAVSVAANTNNNTEVEGQTEPELGTAAKKVNVYAEGQEKQK